MISTFFRSISDDYKPHPWQEDLANDTKAVNRLVRIPTGMGKTLGVLSTWLLHRVVNGNQAWPTRLVWCLPMRTLVEQTHGEAVRLCEIVKNDQRPEVEVGIHVLMGGMDETPWYKTPEQPAILIGTQDMLLSRALNRGYAMPRAAWPQAFGLLNSDVLWVMDEVQLMGVGLATSAQLQAFWNADLLGKQMVDKPRVTWWLSATLQADWLWSPETDDLLAGLKESPLTIAQGDRNGPLWEAAKPIQRLAMEPGQWPELILEAHRTHDPDPSTGRQTLVVVNTVRQACELYQAIRRRLDKDQTETELRLLHSRFRPADRKSWVDEFLSRKTLHRNTNRILIATQVVEAGVDISASCLITELAPWPSLVQRFGRAARYGGAAQVTVVDQEHGDEKRAFPYLLDELSAARSAVQRCVGVSIGEIEDFEVSLAAEELTRLYPYDPLHVLLRDEFDELFDTSPDLSGADMDISRFIREGEQRDVQVFWRDWEGDRPAADVQPDPSELCSVPVGEARAWLKKLRGRQQPTWRWDYVDGHWVACDDDDLRPGMAIFVSPAAGGYRTETGFHGEKPKKNELVQVVEVASGGHRFDEGDACESSEHGSEVDVWKTITTHCREAAEVATQRATRLGLGERFTSIVAWSLQLHDWGKAHPAFARGTYRVEPMRSDLAKAPRKAWRARHQLYQTETHGPRRGFRHELASCLATLELLRGVNPHHPAILGDWHDLLLACGTEPEVDPADWQNNPLAAALNGQTAVDINLLLYLVASHHGKVRVSMQASPQDQDFPLEDNRYVGVGMPIRGVREGDIVPSVPLPMGDTDIQMPDVTLRLAPAALGLSSRHGASWTERVQSLLDEFGPFTLGYLEAIVRSADQSASDESKSPGADSDPRLDGLSLRVGIDPNHDQPQPAAPEVAHA